MVLHIVFPRKQVQDYYIHGSCHVLLLRMSYCTRPTDPHSPQFSIHYKEEISGVLVTSFYVILFGYSR